GQNRTRAATGRATSSAARSACWTAHVLGAASARTKMTHTSKAVAIATPHGPKRSARKPTRVAVTSWHVSSTSSTGFSLRSGCSTRRTRVAAPRRPSSSRARAFTRFILVSAVSDMARKPVKPISTRMAMTYAQSAVFTMSLLVEAGEEFALTALHGAGLLGVGVVHAQQMQDPVHDEQRRLVLVGARRGVGVTAGH